MVFNDCEATADAISYFIWFADAVGFFPPPTIRIIEAEFRYLLKR